MWYQNGLPVTPKPFHDKPPMDAGFLQHRSNVTDDENEEPLGVSLTEPYRLKKGGRVM